MKDKRNAQIDIDALTKAIEKLVASPVLPVAPVAPVAPVLPIVQPNTGDHDLLTRLEENVIISFKQIKDSIKELTDGTTVKITDHETRLKALEISIAKIFTWGTVGLLALGVLQFIIGKFVE